MKLWKSNNVFFLLYHGLKGERSSGKGESCQWSKLAFIPWRRSSACLLFTQVASNGKQKDLDGVEIHSLGRISFWRREIISDKTLKLGQVREGGKIKKQDSWIWHENFWKRGAFELFSRKSLVICLSPMGLLHLLFPVQVSRCFLWLSESWNFCLSRELRAHSSPQMQ